MNWSFRSLLPEKLRKLVEHVCSLLFAVMWGSFVLGVFMRFVFNQPLAGVDEIGLICFLWCVFLACAFVIPEREQVKFDLLYAILPAPVRRGAGFLTAVLAAAVFAMAVPAIYDYLVYMLRQRTPVLGWSFGAVFSCFLVYVLAVIVRSAAAALKLLGSRWREEA